MRTLGWLVVLGVLASSGAPSMLHAEEEGPAAGAPAEPPSIVYGTSRTSRAWLTRPDGSQVAVDEGVTWQGVTVYLSLLSDLIGVEEASGTVLYAVHVGAFWNAMRFDRVTPQDGRTRWAVVLAPGPDARDGADRRQVHDLRTGARLVVEGLEARPSGTPLRPRAAWEGDASRVAEAFTAFVTTEANWKRVQERLFGTVDPARFGTIDFAQEVVLVVSRGDGWNTSGIGFAEAYEDEQRILLRVQRDCFQTIGGGMRARPWGVFVLPRREAKAYDVERNRQGLIGGPPSWTRIARRERLGPPEHELDDLPEATDAPHHGWDGQDEEPPPAPPPPGPPR